MKYFEFGQGNPELMVMLPGGGVCYRGAPSCGTFVLMDVLADRRLTITTTIAAGIFHF